MLLQDLGPAPASGAVELHHIAATIFILKLVDPVLVTVELDEAGIDTQTTEVEGIQDEIGIEVGIVETHEIHHEKGAPMRPILSLPRQMVGETGPPFASYHPHNRLMNLLAWRSSALSSSGAASARLSTNWISSAGRFKL